MQAHLTRHRAGFPPGWTAITTLNDAANTTGIALGVLKLAAGARWRSLSVDTETAWLLMHGELVAQLDDQPEVRLQRGSLFDESPGCIHAPAGTAVTLTASSDAELTVASVDNTDPFVGRVYQPADVGNEVRGKGQVGGTCTRLVRTIFDNTTTDPHAQMVLGEVVTLPGRWSSYPPHHHPQPELYHYRFSKPQGFGFAQLGDEALLVKHHDTVVIRDGQDHAQAAAPGYAMYYAWVIRHLPGQRYVAPEFTAEHAWTLKPAASFWQPPESIDA